MKLYVCWGTFPAARLGGHPCRNAYRALREAGHDPEVIKVYGLGIGPGITQWKTSGREEIEDLTGSPMVPVLVTDSGEAINESKRIVEWAEAHPAGSAGGGATSSAG
jgi:Glutathione S-transferase, N-terminal domain